MVNSGEAGMRAVKISMAGVMLVLVLSGCGQKGPLYREHPGAAAGAATEVREPGPAASDAGDNKADGE